MLKRSSATKTEWRCSPTSDTVSLVSTETKLDASYATCDEKGYLIAKLKLQERLKENPGFASLVVFADKSRSQDLMLIKYVPETKKFGKLFLYSEYLSSA